MFSWTFKFYSLVKGELLGDIAQELKEIVTSLRHIWYLAWKVHNHDCQIRHQVNDSQVPRDLFALIHQCFPTSKSEAQIVKNWTLYFKKILCAYPNGIEENFVLFLRHLPKENIKKSV